METVSGRVISVKEKENRSGTAYQGVTLKTDDETLFWFANYKAPMPMGVTLVVEAESTSPGTGNMTFLNKIQVVTIIAAADTAGETRESTPGLPIEDDSTAPVGGFPSSGERVVPPPAPPNRAPKVQEDPIPSGTIDDLAAGKDPVRYGGAIIFRSGMSKAEVEGVLRAISGVIASVDIRDFDPKTGKPAFFIS